MHSGACVAEKGKYKVMECDACGFKHLYPIPSGDELDRFYQKEYFDLISKGGRAQEIRRQMAGGEEADAELKWLRSTYYKDILHVLDTMFPGRAKKSLMDVGCGTGQFIKFMSENGWEASGIEPSADVSKSPACGVKVYNATLDGFIKERPGLAGTFDSLTMLNVMEHVPDPKGFLASAKRLLKPGSGVICIRVPNDFSGLQASAEKKINKSLWWVAIPDHINYFSVESLKRLVESSGFETTYMSTDFPMELFLLMGDDYVGNTDIGSRCHKKRVDFDLSLSDGLRRDLYRKLADAGIGRDTMIFAKVRQ